MLRRFALLACLIAGLAGCSDRYSPRCHMVCRKGDRCAEKLDDPSYKLDEDECTAACAFLEQDEKGKKIVESYVACVEAAGDDCRRIRDCDQGASAPSSKGR